MSIAVLKSTFPKFGNAMVIHTTTRGMDAYEHSATQMISNSRNPKHGLFKTRLGAFTQDNNITYKKSGVETELLATFSNEQEANEYVRDSIAYFGTNYTILNTKLTQPPR